MQILRLLLFFALVLTSTSHVHGETEEATEVFDRVFRGPSNSKQNKAPRWFDNRTMRVVEKGDTLAMGYAAFIPPARVEYDAAKDPSVPLARRINAGYRLPNCFKPKEWAPLRPYFSTPPNEENANGVAQSSRRSYQPTSWYTVATALFGRLGHVVRLGDHIRADPLTSHYWHGINSMPSPINIPRIFNWLWVAILPENFVKYPYIPWSIWRPWKLSFSSLPSREVFATLHNHLHDPALRPQPSARYPWFQQRPNKVEVSVPSEREQDICSEWPVWAAKRGAFTQHYPDRETCLVLAGEATLTPKGGKPVTIKAGDLFSISQGSSCDWHVTAPIMLHFNFGF